MDDDDSMNSVYVENALTGCHICNYCKFFHINCWKGKSTQPLFKYQKNVRIDFGFRRKYFAFGTIECHSRLWAKKWSIITILISCITIDFLISIDLVHHIYQIFYVCGHWSRCSKQGALVTLSSDETCLSCTLVNWITAARVQGLGQITIRCCRTKDRT